MIPEGGTAMDEPIRKRTPLRLRKLPDYTTGEEIANMVTHTVGAAIAIVVLVLGIILAAWHRNPWAVVGVSIYGFSMIALYSVSSVYHGLRPGMAKKVMQVIDHCTIYLLIAGTYTPILLAAMRPAYPALAWTVFGVEWGVAALAATLTAIDLHRYRVISMVCYLVMGWFIVLALRQILEVLGPVGFGWILAGGISYTVGAILYGIGAKRRYFHSVFHVFVVVGTVCQAIGVLFHVI